MAEDWLRDFYELLSHAGIARVDAEPKAVCPRDRTRIAPYRRLYYAFTEPQRCAICDAEVQPRDALAFE